MKFKKITEHGVRLLMAISNLNTPMNIDELMDVLKLSRTLGTKALNVLIDAGLISTPPFSLKKRKEDITLLNIIECFEEIEIYVCVKSPKNCSFRKGECSACLKFFDLRDLIRLSLSNVTLAQLCDEQKEIDSYFC